jgi:hypothetical protein
LRLASKSRQGQRERGVALIIAIFALMLVSVVAIALVVSTGTDSSLAGNYRTASGAYYAALAGLEEARGRLLWKNPNYLNLPGLFSGTGQPTWSLTQVVYITNPANGETVDPTSSIPANYPDTEYVTEFTWGLSGSVVQQIASVSPLPSAGIPGASYKWVRINPVTEQALNLDVNGDGVIDGAGVLFYDPAYLNSSYAPAPGLLVSSPGSPPTPPTTTSVQALEITALAVLPNGSRRLLQYIVAPSVISPLYSLNSAPTAQALNFPAALTLLGNGVTFVAPGNSNFWVNGQDQCQSSNLVYSVGYTNPSDGGNITSHATPPSNFVGFPPGSGGPPAPPSSGPSTIANIAQSPSNSLVNSSWLNSPSLDAIVQQITQNADVVINGNTTGNGIATQAPAMNAGNPMTIVVNGDLDLNAWHNTGYGLLLVTGTLKYDPDASWAGLVLLIGQGNFVSTRGGSGEIDGAMVIAKTRDASGNLLGSLGASSFSQTGGVNSGKGVNYNSCWVNRALGPMYTPETSLSAMQGPLAYRVLSFHEIPQN